MIFSFALKFLKLLLYLLVNQFHFRFSYLFIGNIIPNRNFLVGDKPRPYKQNLIPDVGAGFIPAKEFG